MFLLAQTESQETGVSQTTPANIVVKGMFRQVKYATIEAWKLFYNDRLNNVAMYCDKTVKNTAPTRYRILSWDDRPESNVFLGAWDLHAPPLERGNNKDPSKQQDAMTENIKAILTELDSGSVPGFLWNKYMSYAHLEASS